MSAERLPESQCDLGQKSIKNSEKCRRYYQANKARLNAKKNLWRKRKRERSADERAHRKAENARIRAERRQANKISEKETRAREKAEAKLKRLADLEAVKRRCRTNDCDQQRDGLSLHCESHRRQLHLNRLRRRREKLKATPEGRSKISQYRRNRRHKKNLQIRERRLSDVDFRDRIKYQKRAIRFKAGIKKWCTEAYLSKAKREDYIYAVALRKWIKQCAQERILKSGVDAIECKRAAARQHSKRRYWEDPEAHRVKAQSYKHSNPQYRDRWNQKRGKLERDLSDGTLTREAVGDLFSRSKKCPYCGDPYKKSRRSLDHIVPLSRANGRKIHSLSNVLVCCRACNGKKHARPLTAFLEEIKNSGKKRSIAPKPREIGRVLGLFAAHD